MFSVIIPVFNKEKSLPRAINSALSQRAVEMEIIAINDGSTDGSAEVLKIFDKPGVRIFHQQNKGVSVARNFGIAEAQGDFIAFLDADDAWHPDFLKTINEAIKDYPEHEWYSTSWIHTDADSQLEEHSTKPNLAEPKPLNFFEHSVREVVANIGSTVIKKSVLNEIGGFPEGVKIYEDQDLYGRLAMRGELVFIDVPYHYYYRDTENRACLQRQVNDMPPFFTKNESIMTASPSKEEPTYWLKEFLINRYLKESSLCFQTKGERLRGIRWLKLCKATDLQRTRYFKGWLYTLLPSSILKATIDLIRK